MPKRNLSPVSKAKAPRRTPTTPETAMVSARHQSPVYDGESTGVVPTVHPNTRANQSVVSFVRTEQPGAPHGQQNTALVPEALVSTADDDVKKTGRAAPATNGSLGPTGNKFVGVMDAPEQRTQPPPPSLTTPTTGRASFVAGLDSRDSVAATAAGGSGTNGVKEEMKREELSPARARMPQTQQKSQNPITGSRGFNQTPNGAGIFGEDAQKPVTSINDQSATVPPSTLGSQPATSQNDYSRRLSQQKDKYTGAEMSKRQSLLGSNPQAGAAATDGTDYINTHAAGLSISGTPGAEPNRPAAVSKASEEALKGPQCSAKPPYEFEKQLDETNGRRKSRSSMSSLPSFPLSI